MSDPNTDKPDELAGTEQPFVQHLMELRDRLHQGGLRPSAWPPHPAGDLARPQRA